jgi:hypothetical protein
MANSSAKSPPSVDSTVFSAAVAKFSKNLTRSQKQRFESCTFKDLNDAIDKIQADLGAKRRARNMSRLYCFVEGMTALGTVVETFLNLSAFVCFIWVSL